MDRLFLVGGWTLGISLMIPFKSPLAGGQHGTACRRPAAPGIRGEPSFGPSSWRVLQIAGHFIAGVREISCESHHEKGILKK